MAAVLVENAPVETFFVLELGKVEVMAENDVTKLRQRACTKLGKEALPLYWSC
jgi:hypothetical protein